MSNNLLNTTIEFKCIYGATFKITQECNVSINQNSILLNNQQLRRITPPPPCPLCPLPSGSPGPCTDTIILPMWSFVSNISITGAAPLTSKSFCLCSKGMKIEPKNFQRINITNEAINFDIYFPPLKNIGSKTQVDNMVETNEENITKSTAMTNEETEISEESYRYALCNYKTCGKAKTCNYITTPHSIIGLLKYDGDSTYLRQNMEEYTPDQYVHERTSITEVISIMSENYGVQHHHIISSRQCYNTIPELVKLGNFYQYNINNANNGICLPSGGGYDNAESIDDKIQIAFDAMNSTKKQWHVGGHSMRLLINALREIPQFAENILTQNATSVITGYDQSVIDLLSKFLNHRKNSYMDSCRINDYENQRNEFCELMNRISERIRLKLVDYDIAPQNCQWFYISKMSLYYAYEEILKDYKTVIF